MPHPEVGGVSPVKGDQEVPGDRTARSGLGAGSRGSGVGGAGRGGGTMGGYLETRFYDTTRHFGKKPTKLNSRLIRPISG